MEKAKYIYAGVISFFYPARIPDTEEEKARARYFINCCLIGAVIFLSYYFSVDNIGYKEGTDTVIAGSIFCLALLFALKLGIPFVICANTFVLGIYFANMYGVNNTGGLHSGTMVNIIEIPILAMLIIGRNFALGWCGVCIATILFYGIYHPHGTDIMYNEEGHTHFFAGGYLGALIGVYVIVLLFYYRKETSQKWLKRKNEELASEREKSEGLLLNILPEEVAEELKMKGIAGAKLFDNTTIFFSDFVNFTEFSERLTPQQLVDELHACFKGFDEIFTKYDIEKIKTIGDAYLAVSGLPVANADHAGDMLKAAVEVRDFIRTRLNEKGKDTFEIRIGIDSGSVIAGIVGTRKYAYDIWGDTVNTAAIMEQNSEAGKINISQTTYELVKDKFTCEYRGEIEAKNRGKLKMYFVT